VSKPSLKDLERQTKQAFWRGFEKHASMTQPAERLLAKATHSLNYGKINAVAHKAEAAAPNALNYAKINAVAHKPKIAPHTLDYAKMPPPPPPQARWKTRLEAKAPPAAAPAVAKKSRWSPEMRQKIISGHV